jgi:hypothetical protein
MENTHKKFGHLMLDLETMAKDSNAAIVSIGAVEFNMKTGETGKEFYVNVSLQSCLDIGLQVDGDTIMWWLRQSDAARQKLTEGDVKNIQVALIEFSAFVESCEGKHCEIWGNSARFDIGIIADAYKKCHLTNPWDFRQERDVRTLVSFHPIIKQMTKFVGTEHNSVHDCLHQIKYCSEIWNKKNNE